MQGNQLNLTVVQFIIQKLLRVQINTFYFVKRI